MYARGLVYTRLRRTGSKKRRVLQHVMVCCYISYVIDRPHWYHFPLHVAQSGLQESVACRACGILEELERNLSNAGLKLTPKYFGVIVRYWLDLERKNESFVLCRQAMEGEGGDEDLVVMELET